MPKIVGLALIVVGAVLLGWGFSASESVGSEISRVFTGAPTDRTIFLLVGGLVSLVVGIGLLFVGRRGRGGV